jgi:uncharacterized protein (TIGR00299 family) protein
MKTLHFECAAGISGDMTLGAFVDLGVDPAQLRSELAKLKVDGWELNFERDERCGITGTHAIVNLCEHGGHGGEGGHQHEGEHHHEHNHWREIRALIKASEITAGAKTRALDIFTRIAEAEASVHGVAVEDVAFHEVGALDSIIDVVGAAICLDILKPDRITASAIELGGGTVKCAHGILPVPAPATLILCRGLPVTTGGFQKEMTTPTGAAILASCVDEFPERANFREIKTGYGIGTRKLDKPNVLRVSWREEKSVVSESWNTEELVLLEANIDDMTGEALGFLMECMFEKGALDATLSPCTMKKSRPGTVVSVLCRAEKRETLCRELFVKSTTIGFRELPVKRHFLPRSEETLSGGARQKSVFFADTPETPLRSKIEYDDRSRVARERNVSLDDAERYIRG